MTLFYSHVPVVFVFLTAGIFTWLFGGTNTPAIAPVVPWAFVFALEVLLFMPQRYHGEASLEARERANRGFARDPMTYIIITLLVVLIIPLFNHGLCKMCDYPKIMAGADPEPVLNFLPFCVNTVEHASILMWVAPIFAAVLATRHGLTNYGRRTLFGLLIWNAAALAILGFIQIAMSAPGPLWETFGDGDKVLAVGTYFSVFGYPNMAGCFFTAAYTVAFGYWYRHWHEVDHETAALLKRQGNSAKGARFRYRWVKAHYPLIAVVLTFFASLATLSRAAILLTFVATGFWFIYVALNTFTVRGRNSVGRVKSGVIVLVAFLVLILSTAIFAPDDYRHEVKTLSSSTIFERVSGDGQCHMRVAGAIFRDYPLFGVGGWGYRHFALDYMTKDEREHFQIKGAANVHNDTLQLFAEHGLVGGGLFFAIVILLLVPIVRFVRARLHRERFGKYRTLAHPTAIFAMPSPVMGAVLAAILAFVHSLGDCPFRSPAVLSLILLLLASCTGFLEEDDYDAKA